MQDIGLSLMLLGDSRDAKLMLRLREARMACDAAGADHCLIAYYGLWVPAFDDPDRSLMEQGLGLLLPKLPGRYRREYGQKPE